MVALSGTLLGVYIKAVWQSKTIIFIFSRGEKFFQNELLMSFSILPSLTRSWYFM